MAKKQDRTRRPDSKRGASENPVRGAKKSGKRGKKPASPKESDAPSHDEETDHEPEESADGAPLSPTPGVAVVGIGASAGGFEALRNLIAALPADTGMAFVVIQHLDPTHESFAAELLSRHTSMPIVQVEDGMRVEPNRLYVIPPNRYLSISGRKLSLSEPVERRGLRVPIDFFFRSLAEDQQERAIGIVLSGTGSDGTLGVREIKAAGGLVMVQSPETAQYDGMPRSALATGVVDFTLPVEEMPDALVRYLRHPYLNGATTAATAADEKTPDDFNAIVGILRARIKYDFSCYKKGTLMRRIQRRMGINHIDELRDYATHLRQSNDEVTALYKDLLINVTNFFREPEAWDELEQRVIVPLVSEHGDEPPIRVWVPACATGEEAYSLAMLLIERCKATDKGCDLQIFASDIDADALAVARVAIYPENIAADVSPDRLRDFFIKGEHTYRIKKEVRDAVVFAEQNVISHPPFSKLDLISCRNLMIYLEPEVQKKLLGLFHFALREGGFLFLGNSETIHQQRDLFEPISKKWRIYRRVGPPRYDRLELPIRSATPRLRAVECAPERGAQSGMRISTLAPQLILQRLAPAAALITRSGEVQYLSGPIDRYLQLPSGQLGVDIVAMAREGVRTKLRSAIHQAMRDNQTVTFRGLRIKHGRKLLSLRLSVEPLHKPREAEGMLLVTFAEEPSPSTGEQEPTGPDHDPQAEPEVVDHNDSIIRTLEDELRMTREDLQSTIEELETSNEEFKASNEEVTSINEELQSTNEELETSKEELQSLNEELQTVNNQLEQKIAEVESTNNDLSNLLSSTDVATIFLDRRFRLRRFTPAATRLLRVIPGDVGRSISDFARNFSDEHLLSDSEHVLQALAPLEREILDDAGNWFTRRILPYRTEDDRIEGVVITFTDVTRRRHDEDELRGASRQLEERIQLRTTELQMANASLANERSRLAAVIGGTAAAIIVASLDDEIQNWSDGAERILGFNAAEVRGQSVLSRVFRGAPLDFQTLVKRLRETGYAEFEFRSVHKDGSRVYLAVTCSLVRNDTGHFSGVCYLARDVGDQKRLEQQIAELSDEERQRLGRELHDSVSQQLSAVGMLLATLKSQLGEAPAKSILERAEQSVDESKRQIRSLTKGLFPVDVDARGLRVALEELVQSACGTVGANCQFECGEDVSLDDNFTATQLYLIAREAVSNATRHAQATQIVVSLQKRDSGVEVSIHDNGKGMPPNAEQVKGFGLRIMRHRCGLIDGQFEIHSSQEGTTIRCHVQRRRPNA